MVVVVVLRNDTVRCRAMELQGKGITPPHLAPLLAIQAETIAAAAAIKSVIHRSPSKHALEPVASTSAGCSVQRGICRGTVTGLVDDRC